MNTKEKILSLLRSGAKTQGEIAELMYGDRNHGPYIYSALMQLANDGVIERTGSHPSYYSLTGTEVFTTETFVKNTKLKTNSESLSREKIEVALTSICEGEFKLKEKVSLSDLVQAKVAFSAINNLITKELTKLFINKLAICGKISEDQEQVALEQVDTTSVNANGYDFVLESPKIIAEVKGNIPYKGNRYGVAQIKGIKKDIDGLRYGKYKALQTPCDYAKFLIVLDTPETNAREAIESLMGKMTDIKFVNQATDLDLNDKQSIHILLIPLSASIKKVL